MRTCYNITAGDQLLIAASTTGHILLNVESEILDVRYLPHKNKNVPGLIKSCFSMSAIHAMML